MALDAALHESAAAGLPEINVTPNQGKLLSLLARSIGARRILEIGTLGGYSTIWLARALPPNGRLVTLELDPDHANVARANFKRAGLSAITDLRVGPARETLDELETQEAEPFDFVFIDADKESTADYFLQVLKLSHAGTVIIVDNVIRGGEVANAATEDPKVLGVRRFNEVAAAEKRVSVTAIQTVGSKGYDGFALALVLE